MPCFSPIKGFRGPDGRMVPVKGKSVAGVPLSVPCGGCIGCRRDKARDWGTRIAHEAQMHEENIFVTLTYSDENLPPSGGLSKPDFQKFMKRLRRRLEPLKLRYYGCGEYGDKTGRPHYHAIIFGWAPSDGVLWRVTETGNRYKRSPFLEDVWGLGHVEYGDVSAGAGEYVAGYVLKKLGGPKHRERYIRIDDDGEVHHVDQEFGLMSTRPGIGESWFNKYECDAFPSDFVTIDGQKRPVPNFYKRKLKDRFQLPGSNPDRLLPIDDAKLLADRKKSYALANAEDNTPERLDVREELLHRKQAQYVRKMEDET